MIRFWDNGIGIAWIISASLNPVNVDNFNFLGMPWSHSLPSLEVGTGSLANQPFLASLQLASQCRASAPILTFATRIVLTAATGSNPQLLFTSTSERCMKEENPAARRLINMDWRWRWRQSVQLTSGASHLQIIGRQTSTLLHISTHFHTFNHTSTHLPPVHTSTHW